MHKTQNIPVNSQPDGQMQRRNMAHSIENTAENFKTQNKAQSSSDANTAQLGVNRQVYASES
jgi:hypothetical protein